MYIDNIDYIDTLDYNNLYTPGTVLVKLGTTDYATLTDWQNAVGQDTHSFNENITFDNEGNADLHISSGMPKIFGTLIGEINTDIDGDPRYEPRPCIGADEHVKTPMRGLYIVDKAGTEDYNSFGSAISDLIDRGIDSSVVINVNAGEYNEQIEITKIEGSSDENIITIQSTSADTADVKIYYDPAASDVNYTVYLNGTNHIYFKNLSIFSRGSSDFGNVILINNGVKDIKFEGNHFYGKTGSCSFKDKYLVRDDLSTADTNIVFAKIPSKIQEVQCI